MQRPQSSRIGTEEDTAGFKVGQDLIEVGVAKIKTYVGKRTALFPQTIQPSPEDEIVLKRYSTAQLARAIDTISHMVGTVKATPFAVGQRCVDNGYDIAPKVDALGNGTLVVGNASAQVNLAVTSGKVNPIPLKELGMNVLSFEPSLHRLAIILSTFYDIRADAKRVAHFSPVQMDDRVKEILSFDRVVPGSKNLRLAMADFLQYVEEHEEKLKQCSGIDLTDYMYELVIKYNKEAKELFKALSQAVLCRVDGQAVPYIFVADKKMKFRAPVIVFPQRVLDKPCGKDTITYEQALYVLSTLRNFRGGDQRERGGIPRMAYMLVEFSSLYSEVSYWVFDLTKMEVVKYPNIYIIAHSDVVTLKEIVMALEVMQYKGTVHLIGTEPHHVGKMKNGNVRSAGDEFDIKSCPEFLLPQVKDAFILDLRVVSKASGKIADIVAADDANVAARLTEMKNMSSRVVVRVPLCPAATKWKCWPSIRVHNLVGYAEENEGGTPVADVREIWWTSVAANILRSYRAFHVAPLPVIANKIGLKIHAAPLIKWCGKVGYESFVQHDMSDFVEYNEASEEAGAKAPVVEDLGDEYDYDMTG